MKNLLKIFGLSLAFFTSACAQVNMAIVNAPTHFQDILVQKDVSFGSEPNEKLDIYSPKKTAGGKNLPVVVFYYGGRWEDGSKEMYKFVGTALAKQNYIVVIPDYRKYPDVKFPTFVEDGAKSLAWVSDNISEYGGDPEQIHLSGHSAGAHIASLLTTDARYLKRFGKDRSDVVKSFVGLAGPYAFTPLEDDLKDMFAPPENYPQMRATTFIDGRQPPMLLLWGDKDQYVGKFNMEKLAEAVHQKGGCVGTKIYKDTDHIWILGDLSWLGRGKIGVLKDWTNFMEHKPCEPKQ